MKVQVKQQPKEFTPITLEITLESKEELEIMNDIFGLNITIPEALKKYKSSRIENLLGKISGVTSNLMDK